METRVIIQFPPENRAAAQLRFMETMESLQHQGKISDEEWSLLAHHHRPVGIDEADRIVIRYDTRKQAAQAKSLPALVEVNRELRRAGLGKLMVVARAPRVRKTPRRRAGPPRQRVLYLPTRLVSTTLPHRRVKGKEFVRINGDMTMSLTATQKSGLPYGVYPRLALMHLTTRAVLEGRRHFLIGESATDFLASLGITNSGGRRGSATRARAQLRMLASTAFTWESRNSGRSHDRWRGMLLADEWDSRPGSGVHVTLTASFFAMARSSSVPLDAKIVQKLRRSPMALDVYAWLTWRVSTLKKETVIPWLALERQLGCDFRTPRQFRWKFRKALTKVRAQWDCGGAEPQERGLLLRPCAPSVLSWLEHDTPHARRPPDE
ncbi:MAG: replication protein RepA [Bryobacterales bacterium]|nr:replication protein RepA [Bryobacterales bacterium]